MITANIPGVHELLLDGVVHVHLPGNTKEEVLHELISLLENHPLIGDFKGVRDAVLQREEMMSTGVGKGLALPQSKTPAVDGIIAAFATTLHPIDFDAIDGHPVKMMFLMVSTDREKSQHIKILSRVSRLMNEDSFRSRLLEAQQPEAILKIFQEGESSLI